MATKRPSCSATIVTALLPAAPAAALVPDSIGVRVLAGERRPVSHRRVGEGGEPERSQRRSLVSAYPANLHASRLVARDGRARRRAHPPALAVCWGGAANGLSVVQSGCASEAKPAPASEPIARRPSRIFRRTAPRLRS